MNPFDHGSPEVDQEWYRRLARVTQPPQRREGTETASVEWDSIHQCKQIVPEWTFIQDAALFWFEGKHAMAEAQRRLAGYGG